MTKKKQKKYTFRTVTAKDLDSMVNYFGAESLHQYYNQRLQQLGIPLKQPAEEIIAEARAMQADLFDQIARLDQSRPWKTKARKLCLKLKELESIIKDLK